MDSIDATFASFSTLVADEFTSRSFKLINFAGIIPGIGGYFDIHPSNCVPVPIYFDTRRKRIHESCRFFDGQNHAKIWFIRQKRGASYLGAACAIPAIIATRNIENWKERLITIRVNPITTCSARLPVYAIIIALVIPDDRFFGFLNMQGVTLMLLYLLGFGTAIFSAYILNKILKIKGKTYFVVEMPNYKLPLLKNVAINANRKNKSLCFWCR